MKVSIGHFFGKCLWLFLFFCICLNGHVVDGQTVNIALVTFMEDLSAFNMTTCFSSPVEVASGQINVSTEPNILTQSASEVAINMTADNGCQYHAIPIAIVHEQLGTQVTVKIAASSTTNHPLSVGSSSFKVTIPGPTLFFDGDMYSVEEGDSNENINVMLDVCQTPITFSSTASFSLGGSALAGQDYIQPTGFITIQEQTSCTTLQIDIVSDILAEATETFIVQIQPVTPSRLSATRGTTTVTIFDDDDPITTPQIMCPLSPLVFNKDPDEQLTTVNIGSNVTCIGGTSTCGTQSFPVGSHTVTCFCFIDSTSDMCSVTVEIKASVNIAPTLSGCPVDTVNIFTTTPICNDAEDGPRTVTCIPPAGNNFQAGITTPVSCSCTDNAGSTSDCTFNVLAPVNTAPVLSGCPVDTVNNFTTSPRCNDAEDGARMVTCDPPAGNNFQAGMTTSVTCSCIDNAGSTSNCTFNVLAPKITCPVSPLVFNVDPDEQDTTVNIDSVVTCEGGTLTCGAQSKFSVGSHTVACYCFSGSTNDMCSVTVEIKASILEKWYKRSLLGVSTTLATEIGSTYAPATDTTSEILPSRATTTIPTTTTGMLATDTTQTMMTDVMISTEPDLTTVMFLTDTTQTMMTELSTSVLDVNVTATTIGMFPTNITQIMMTASPTSRPDATETTNMTGMFTTNTTQTMTTGMFTTNTTQTMTTGMFTTNTTQTMTTALPTSRPDVTETTNMTEMSTNTTPTMTPDPCLNQPCNGNANCTHNEGLVKCTCREGFYGDGTTNGTGCTGCPRNVPDEKFGLNCSSPCTCASKADCDLVTGDCSGDECGGSMQPTCDKNNLTVMILQDDMGVDENTAFTLNCNVNLGTADVNVTWTYPADAEIQSGTFRGNLTSFLTVSNAGKENTGIYTCIARLNKPTETVTSRNDSININVRDFPEIDNLSLQEKSSSSLKFTWEVKDDGNDDVTCRANYFEIGINIKKPQSCKNTSCELSKLSPNTGYNFSVVCHNTAGPSNTLSMTSTTSSTVPEEVPDLNDADVNSTFITVTLKPVSTENGPISCYEFVVAERSEVGTNPDNDLPFSSVKENSDGGTPYRAVVMNHVEYTAQKTVIIGAEGNQSTCELPRNSRRKRASELVSSQTLTARNDPLNSANNYSIFLRVYVLSTDGKYTYSSSDYEHYQTKPTKEEPSSSGAALAVVLIILIIVIIGIVIAIFFVWRKRSKENYAEQDGEIIALGENGINDQTDSSPGINSGFEITVMKKLDPINIDELGNCILTKHQNSNRIFKQEFMSLLDVNKDATHEAFSHETNYQEKNRYINIFCYDHSRVKLEELEGVEQSDYINANYIDGYKQPNKFIAAQGPKTETLEDHWRMIWEQKTATIIMLARCFEDGGREKCAQYWPDEGSQKFGQFTVHLDSTAECSDYLIRKFRVTKEGEEEGTYRSINQFHYLAWPDHGVPEYPYTLLAFVKRIRQMTPPKPEKGNIIVHCSAGVGRTGTYITIDAMLDRLKEEKTVDIYNFVNSMRLNRRLLVQTEVQYTFIHHAMHEEHLYGHTEIPLADLHQYFRRLRLKTHIDDNSPLHNEFKTAATLPIRITKCIDASKEGNKEKNRTRNYLPYDHNRVLLERLVGDENSTYINASYIKGYERKNMYIATQAPMENTVHDFWRLVWESLTATVIMLTDLEEKGNEMCVKFWPEEEPQTFGNLTVELASENEEEDYTVHNFSLSSTEGVSGRKVTMFRFHGWPEVGTPNCCESVIDLVNVAHEHQQNSEREESPDHSRHPIVVFCHTGVGRTAVWIALSILMERARAEGVVDVFQTVRTLRQQRQHMLHDATQYEFLYQAVLKHLDTFDQYANYR